MEIERVELLGEKVLVVHLAALLVDFSVAQLVVWKVG